MVTEEKQTQRFDETEALPADVATEPGSDKALAKKSKARRYIVLPVCLIALNIFNKIILYKLEMVDDLFLRVFLILLLLITGFSFVGMVLTPAVERMIDTILRGFGKVAGRVGMVVIGLLFAGAIYFAYLNVYCYGLESVLPEFLHNPPEIAQNRLQDRVALQAAKVTGNAVTDEVGARGTELLGEASEGVQKLQGLLKLYRTAIVASAGGVLALLVFMYVYALRKRKKKAAKAEDESS